MTPKLLQQTYVVYVYNNTGYQVIRLLRIRLIFFKHSSYLILCLVKHIWSMRYINLNSHKGGHTKRRSLMFNGLKSIQSEGRTVRLNKGRQKVSVRGHWDLIYGCLCSTLSSHRQLHYVPVYFNIWINNVSCVLILIFLIY